MSRIFFAQHQMIGLAGLLVLGGVLVLVARLRPPRWFLAPLGRGE